MGRRRPHHDLQAIQHRLRNGDRLIVTHSAYNGANDLYLDVDDIRACVLDLTEDDCWKSNHLSEGTYEGLVQDVFRVRYSSRAVYLKLQLGRRGEIVVISFKQDEDP